MVGVGVGAGVGPRLGGGAVVAGARVLLDLLVHQAGPGPRLLPTVVVLHQAGYGLVRQLRGDEKSEQFEKSRLPPTHHLSYPVEALSVELEGLLEQHLVLDGPLVGEGREVRQVHDGPLEVVLVPEEHAQRLFAVVTVLVLGQHYVVLHCTAETTNNEQLPGSNRDDALRM